MIDTQEVALVQLNNMQSSAEDGDEELHKSNGPFAVVASLPSAQQPVDDSSATIVTLSSSAAAVVHEPLASTPMVMTLSQESSSLSMNGDCAPPQPFDKNMDKNTTHKNKDVSSSTDTDENSANIAPSSSPMVEDMSTFVTDAAVIVAPLTALPPSSYSVAADFVVEAVTTPALASTEESSQQPMDITDAANESAGGQSPDSKVGGQIGKGGNQDDDSTTALDVLETTTKEPLLVSQTIQEVNHDSFTITSDAHVGGGEKGEVMTSLPVGNAAAPALPLHDESRGSSKRELHSSSPVTAAAVPEEPREHVLPAADPLTINTTTTLQPPSTAESKSDNPTDQQQISTVVGAAVVAAPELKAPPLPQPAPPAPPSQPEVIDLLEDDDDDDDDEEQQKPQDKMDIEMNGVPSDGHQRKRQKLGNENAADTTTATSSFVQPGRSFSNATSAMEYNVSAKAIEQMYHRPQPTTSSSASYASSRLVPKTTTRASSSFGSPPRSARTSTAAAVSGSPSLSNMYHMDKPQYISLPPDFVSTWQAFMPGTPKQPPTSSVAGAASAQVSNLVLGSNGLASAMTTMSHNRNVAGPPTAAAMIPRRDRRRYFQLSLLNVNEFTITGLPVSYDSPPTPVTGLRAPIRQISREHGKAVYERDSDSETSPDDGGGGMNGNNGEGGSPGGGKWRIPLGAYQAFYAYLRSDKYTQVDGIPLHQLQIASLARERQAKGYPTVEALIKRGVPTRLAKALAPFQRGGVDFVLDKNGRALIADDMGLGKTIQGIASMSVYHKEWPLLVLCPSSARYHWEAEFQHWLGPKSHEPKVNMLDAADAKESSESSKEMGDADSDNSEKGRRKTDIPPKEEMILHDSQIHVLTSSRAAILPNKDTKVVICSYGLVPLLIKSQAIVPGVFKCAIVDESHMLKNKSAKRTAALVPVLAKADRCVLLSGTPALARPGELWPQLFILGTQQYGWWEDEAEFIEKYVKKTSARRRAELHTMLSGTVMIRRLKVDILKTLPKKRREKAILHVINSQEHRDEFKHLLMLLREGKGAMGRLARTQHSEDRRRTDQQEEVYQPHPDSNAAAGAANPTTVTNADLARRRDEAVRCLKANIEIRLANERTRVQQEIVQFSQQFGEEEGRKLQMTLDQNLRTDLDNQYHQKLAEINKQFSIQQVDPQQTERTAVLSRLYSLSGEVKIPLIVDMLNRWLDDPTKGKICIFAHHISVLDAIGQRARLSNSAGSSRKFIRIDGSTSPKVRQQQISAYQSDPLIRVALLGITAAGVAVTLTACSTVWFAELFWTPAIMIQAEDRCHRIGQQARVKCLYFVAKGTIDDVLWRLIEKKFQDLGEFVEGKEKLKMVVDHTYANTKELFSIFHAPAIEDDEEDDDEEDDDLKDLLMNSDIEHDIEALGEEEQRMLLAVDAEDEEGENQASSSNKSGDQKAEALVIDDDDDDDDDDINNDDVGEGRSQEAAITLSDDEDDAKPPAKIISELSVEEPKPADAAAVVEQNNQLANVSSPDSPDFLLSQKFTNCRLYQMFFRGPSLGLEIVFFHGRVVIAKVNEDLRTRPYGKPSTGDVIVAVNGHPLPMSANLAPAREAIREALQYPPVLIAFAEDPMVHDFFQQKLLDAGAPPSSSNVSQEEPGKMDRNLEAPPPSAEDIIELSDDSEDED